jgi:hypothetical protein
MKRYAGIGLGLAVLVAALVRLSSSGQPEPARAHGGESSKRSAERAPRPELAHTAQQGSSGAAQVDSVMDTESEKLLSKLDDMADLLETTTSDCDVLAEGISTIIGTGPLPSLEFALARGRKADPAAVELTTARFERFSRALKGGMTSCRAQLQPHLRRLHGEVGDENEVALQKRLQTNRTVAVSK